MPTELAEDHMGTDQELSSASRLRSDALDLSFDAWLAEQCKRISNTLSGVLFFSEDPAVQALAPVALWPDETAQVEALLELVEQAVEERCALITSFKAETATAYGVAFPVQVDAQVQAVVALVVGDTDESAVQEAMAQLEWGAAALEAHLYERLLGEQRRTDETLRSGTDLLAAILAEKDFEAAGTRFVLELAGLLRCERVTLGYVKRGRLKVRFVSHSAQFGNRMDLVNSIADAMAEALDQKCTLVYPPPHDQEALITRAHQSLTEKAETASALSIPLYREGGYYAVLTLERAVENFDASDARFAEAIGALVARSLEDKRLNDRWLITKIWDSLCIQLERILGSGYILRKIVWLSILIVTLFFSFYETDYKLAADANLEGAVQRVIAAPFNGYLRTANVRAGDITHADDVVAVLDDRDFRLEAYKWKSERAQRHRQLQEALGARDRAKIRILTAQVEQAEAELNLVENKLKRVKIRAPFDGIIVSGDLSQRLGSAVEQGQELFKIAPLNAYRVIVRVPERRIDDVNVGQSGRVLLAALPNEPVDFRVTRITPITEAINKETFFRVEAKLIHTSPRLRPGMEGIAKVDIDSRLLISIWGRDTVEWLRLKYWSFWG